MLNDIGHRNGSTGSHQNDLKQVGIINVVNTGIQMSTRNTIPRAYLQESYCSLNSSVCLSTCLAVRSIAPTLAQSMLHVFEKKKNG